MKNEMVNTENPIRQAYSVKSAASQINCSENFIRRKIVSGELKAKKLGKKIVVLDSSLKEFIENQADYK